MSIAEQIREINTDDLRYEDGTTLVGQENTPGLPAREMQLSVENLGRNVIIPALNRVIGILNGSYTKDETDAAIQEKMVEIGAGDMAKSQYDPSGAVLAAGGIPAYTAENAFNREPKEIPFSVEEIHEKTLAGDFSGLRVKDYKTVTLTTGEVVEMQIAGINVYKNHGDIALGNHIIWCSRDCLAQTYQMRASNTNNGTANEKNPFRASALFSTLQDTIYPTLPEDWRNIIGNMRCLYGERYSSSGTVTADTGLAWQDRGRLFLPTTQEVFGNNAWSENYECCGGGLNIQWPIFIGGNVIKGLGRGVARCSWWLCAADALVSMYFCNVNGDGNNTRTWATESLGVPLCFITI